MAKDAEKNSKKERKHFFKDFKAELKKVIWPTPKQVVNNTIAVITIVLITAVIVFALDLLFKAINTYGIDNIRNIVKSENSVQENTIDSDLSASEESENLVNEEENQSTEKNTDDDEKAESSTEAQ